MDPPPPHPPPYCMIIIINKKREQRRTFPAQMFLFFTRTIAASGLPGQKSSFELKGARRSGARGKSGSRTRVCAPVKYHNRRNVGGKEDLERGALAGPGSGGRSSFFFFFLSA